jgi:methionyl-tRNA synthetase
LRYALTSNAPETKDNDFTWKDFQARNNNELVAIYGNFVNRALSLTQKYYNGNVPQPDVDSDYEKQIRQEIISIKQNIENYIENYKFREALKEAMNICRLGNKYLADTEPWKIQKTDEARVRTILYYSLQLCAISAILNEAFLPFSSKKLLSLLNIEKPHWDTVEKFDIIPINHTINAPELLFEKIEDAQIDIQIQKLQHTKEKKEKTDYKPKEIKPLVEFDDFQKIDIRVGTVLECIKVPKTDKLLQFRLDDGMGCRTIVSGIAQSYPNPEELVGTQVCFIANFAGRKLKSIESQGMILSAENSDGKLVLVKPQELVTNGVSVG